MKENQELELSVPKPQSLAAYDPSLSGVDLNGLFAEAVKQGSAMEVIKELRAMESEFHSRTAKAKFDAAMSGFQSECPIILKEKGVPDRSGKAAFFFAPLEVIEVQIRPLLRKHGFSHTFDTDTSSAQGWVIAKCIVKHQGGHSETSTAKFPLGTKTQIMSDTQQFAAALTFANRRALQNAYGLVLAGQDLDGATGKLKPKGPSAMQPPDLSLKDLARELWEVLRPVRGTEKNWNAANQWLWREEILDGAIPEAAPELSAERFKQVIAASKAKL